MKVLITGASRGIGKAVALKLQDKYSLILHASSEENLDTLWNELNNKDEHEKLCADFTDNELLKNFCSIIKKIIQKICIVLLIMQE